jgi:superoxide dismutase
VCVGKVEMLQEMFPDKEILEIKKVMEESFGNVDDAVTKLLALKHTTSGEGMVLLILR